MGTKLPSSKGAQPPPNFRPIPVAAKWLHESSCHLVSWYGASPQPRPLFVRQGPRSTLRKKGAELPSPIFGLFLLWPNGCMHQDTTWCGGGPQPRGLCVRWGPSPPNFLPMFIIVIVISLEHCTMHIGYWFVQVQVQVLVFYAFYF